MSATEVTNTRRGACYFCKGEHRNTAVYNYRVGPTGKRGTYRRRICVFCVGRPAIAAHIRDFWRGK